MNTKLIAIFLFFSSFLYTSCIDNKLKLNDLNSEQDNTTEEIAPFCQPNSQRTINCTPDMANAIFATRIEVCNTQGTNFLSGVCIISQCSVESTLQNNQCITISPTLCTAGSITTLDCHSEIANSLTASRLQTCTPDGLGYTYETCTVSSCQSGYEQNANSCTVIIELPPEQICNPGSTTTTDCHLEISNSTSATRSSTCNQDGMGFTSGVCTLLSCSTGYVQSQNSCTPVVTPPETEIPDTDSFITTAHGYTLRNRHPRVIVTHDELQSFLARMHGSNAREPYISWFNRVQAREDAAAANSHELMSLALLYKSTNDSKYLTWYISQVDSTLTDLIARGEDERANAGTSLLYSMDILWYDIPDIIKYKALESGSKINSFYWHSGANTVDQSFGYHGAAGRDAAIALAGMFAYESILNSPEIVNNRDRYIFDSNLYVAAIAEELSETGTFWRTENRIAGDPTLNSALPGSLGGMYDNFGYDTGEESHSIYLVSAFSTITGQDRLTGFNHDQYRGQFHQYFQVPHRGNQLAIIWNTQTTWGTGPTNNARALTAYKYQDPYMQYFSNDWRQSMEDHTYDYYTTAMWWMLLFYDDSLNAALPSTNPTARYFSGPGLVSMRSDWTDDAALAFFVSGDGISRRYEDGNSFIIHRKTGVIPHTGARIRNNDDNSKHCWYNIRSISNNTMKIFDPDESNDYDSNSSATNHLGALHSGVPLVNSDKMGGQLFETAYAPTNNYYSTAYGGFQNNPTNALNIKDTGDVIKYEHSPGDYTYTVGDAVNAYSRKIDLFEREFLFIRPDVFVIFDRVRSANANFRKVWTMHTIDRPDASIGTPVATGLGMRTYNNSSSLEILNSQNNTYIDSLLPKQNRVKIRGGDSVLFSGGISTGNNIGGANILENDIPRWLEIFASGIDSEGSITITGRTSESVTDSETINFTSTTRKQTFIDSRRTSYTITSLTDTTQNWQTDQWKGFTVFYNSGRETIITGNSNNTLYGNFEGGADYWHYTIYKKIANTYKHWQRIDSVTTTDMSLTDLTISVPHYFDTEDVYGQLYSFSPHTDGIDDGYRKREDIGQWTLEIEATTPQVLDNFLNVISLKDPNINRPSVSLIEGTGVSGALVDNYFAIFSNDEIPTTNTTVSFPAGGLLSGIITDLKPTTTYYYNISGRNLEISESYNSQWNSFTSSNMGVVKLSFQIQ